MKVVAAVNGLITSEIAALYALRYAAFHGFTLTLLHVTNPDDSWPDVEKSMVVIEEAATTYKVTAERVRLAGNPIKAISDFLAQNRVDTLFCATRRRHHLLENSLSDHLIRLALPADLVVVQVVRLDGSHVVRNMVLPIREDGLSVKKFTLFAGLAKAYGAEAEIYSINLVNSKKLAALDMPNTRALLRKLNDQLAHYTKLARFMGLSLHIKHAVTRNEVDQVLHHLAHHDFQLMVIGGRRLSMLSRLFKKRPIERLFHDTPINMLAFYGRDNG